MTFPILKDHGQTNKAVVSAVPAVASASTNFAGAGRCVACRGHPATGAIGRRQEELLDLVQAPFLRHCQAAASGRFLQSTSSGGPARSFQARTRPFSPRASQPLRGTSAPGLSVLRREAAPEWASGADRATSGNCGTALGRRTPNQTPIMV